MSWLGLQRLRTFIIAEYHQRIHSETGMPPQARWDEGGFLPHLVLQSHLVTSPETARQLGSRTLANLGANTTVAATFHTAHHRGADACHQVRL